MPVFLVAFLPACYSWQPVTVSPEEVIRDEQPLTVRLTSRDGSRMDVRNPSFSNDSIVGFTDSGLVRAASSEVELLEVSRFNFLKTGIAVVTHAGIIVGFIAAVIRIQPHYYGL